MAQMSNLFFAVGLREENAEEMLGKIAPLARYVPGEVKPRVIRKVDTKEKPCVSEVCKERRYRLQSLESENDDLKSQLKEKEAKLAAVQNKVHLTEKSITLVDEKIDTLKSQLEGLQIRIPSIEAESVQGEEHNATLESRLEELKRNLYGLQNHQDDDQASLSTNTTGQPSSPNRGFLLPDPNQKIVFAKSKIFDVKSSQAAREVSALSSRVGNAVVDTDSDDD